MKLLKFFKKTFFQFVFGSLSMLILMLALLWLSMTQPEQLQNIHHIISQNKMFFIACRWALIIALFVLWPRMIHYWSSHRHWLPEKALFWIQQRFRVLVWLALFELIVCENLLLFLIRLLGVKV